MNYQSLALKVFVYGTLKPGEANYQHYCEGHIETQIPAYTLGNLYALPFGYPAMTVGKNRVRGVVLEFSNPKALSSLDRLEDYQERRASHLNEYYRSLTIVYGLDHQPITQAWAYYMTPERVRQHGGIEIVSGNWSANSYLKSSSSI